MSRVALIEDHERLGALMSKALSRAGIETDVFARLDIAASAIMQCEYAVILMDRGLPDGDGLDLLRRLRRSGNQVPCLMLTALDALHDRVDGLEAGADDYLPKPFAMEELVARVRALMRRPKIMQRIDPKYEDLEVFSNAGCMNCGQESISLSASELQIILCLMNAQGQAVRRGSLENAAWGLGEGVTPNALDVALHRLRKKLQAIDSHLSIVNVRGHGYALRLPQTPT